MSKKKVWLLYGIYGFAAVVFFLYYLFPVEAVKRIAVDRLQRQFPQLQADIDQARLVFPTGLRFDDVAVFRQNMPYFEASQVTVRAAWLSLVTGGKSFTYDIDAAGGKIQGRAVINDRQIDMVSDLEKLRLEELPALQSLIPLGLAGVLNGKVSFQTESENKRSADIRVNVSECIVQLAEPFLNIDVLRFSSVDADAMLQDRQIKLTRCIFRGDEINGDLSGSGILRDRIEQSTLNLTGKLQPNAALLQQLGGDMAVNFLKGAGPGGLSFRVTGSFDKPKVSFN
jgi:type II secretion system protein N